MVLRLVVLVWLWGFAAGAQVVTVRSGQHGGFTRLVLTLPAPGGWDFGRTPDGYGLRVRGGALTFDTSTVFDRIGRERVSAVWVDSESNVLRISIDCTCHAIAEPFRAGIIVVDVRDGAAPSASPFEASLDGSNIASPVPRSAYQQRPRSRPRDFVPVRILPFGPLAGSARPAIPISIPVVPTPSGPRIRALHDDLLIGFARGVAEGAVYARVPSPPRTSGLSDAPVVQQLPVVTDPLVSGRPDQLLIRDPKGSSRLPAGAATCTSESLLAIASWADQRPPMTQIAEGNARLLGEFDRPDPQGLERLARLYLHFGFGAEARSLLRAWPQVGPEQPVLLALADILERRGSSNFFKGMSTCAGPAAMWAILAGEAVGKDTPSGAVLLSFFDLPPWLRRYLGQDLADAFIEAGDTVTATAIRDSVSRAPGVDDGAASLIGAKVAQKDSNADEAEAALSAVADKTGPNAAVAMATLLDSLVTRGEAPLPDQIVALEAVLQENRGTAEAAILRRALARALIVSGDVQRAFRNLGTQDVTLFPELWKLAAERAEDLEIVVLAVTPPPGSVRDLPLPSRLQIAERLVRSGFPDLGQRWVEGDSSQAADLLRAEAALLAGDGRSALRHLAGQSGAHATRIRAEAQESLGNMIAAREAWEDVGETERIKKAVFLDRDWSTLSTLEPPEFRDALAGLAPTELSDDLGPLARARSLLEASRSSRDRILALLTEMRFD